MRIRPSILGFVAIVAVLVALLVLHGRKKTEVAPLAALTSTNNAPFTGSGLNSSSVVSVANTSAPIVNVAGASQHPQKPTPGGKSERMIEILSTYNDQPIVFYGKLDDQFSNVIADATVNFDVRVMDGQNSTIVRGHVTSDANGLFAINGYHGQDLSIVPKKKGYALASLNGGGNYSHLYPEEQRLHPDASNPVLIKMWKLQGAEPLVTLDKTYKLRYTSSPVTFDLLAGQIVSTGGDVRITINRAPGVIAGRNRLDWNFQIEAVDGGLMDSSGMETVSYAAPDIGYQQNMTFNFSTNSPFKWAGGFNQALFFTSRNGQVFGKVDFSFRINENPDDFMYVKFSGVANANGSRNWEGAPNTLNSPDN